MEPSKQDFQSVFGHGYTESFVAPGYAKDKAVVIDMVATYATGGVALDIGCGSGQLTLEWLVPRFDRVICLDVIERKVPFHPKITYIEVPDRDYSCYGVADCSVDFTFSLGCLCHLTNSANQAYIDSVYRVLKPGGIALLMFADWTRDPLSNDPAKLELGRQHCREHTGDCCWAYNDLETTTAMIAKSPFRTFKHIHPECRDTWALLTKPS